MSFFAWTGRMAAVPQRLTAVFGEWFPTGHLDAPDPVKRS